MSDIEDRDEIVSEIRIAARPERVFQALVDPEQVPRWWGRQGAYGCTSFSADLRAGDKWRCAGVGGRDGAFEITGEIVSIDPPRLLVYTWTASWTGPVTTTVRWELIPVEGGTLVRVRHSGLAAHPELAESYRGWPGILGWLGAFVEGGGITDWQKAS